jgi:hypothetical protein
MRFNINDRVRVKLTDLGRKIHRENWEPIVAPRAYHPRDEDKDGWSEWQMWELMNMFGPHLANGSPVPFETEIEIVDGLKLRDLTNS